MNVVMASSAWDGWREAGVHATLAYSAPRLQRPVDFNEEPMKVAIHGVSSNMEPAKVLPSTALWKEDIHGQPPVAAVRHMRLQNDSLELLCDKGSGGCSPTIVPSVPRQKQQQQQCSQQQQNPRQQHSLPQQQQQQQQQKQKQKQKQQLPIQLQSQERTQKQQKSPPSLQFLRTALTDQAYPVWGTHLKSVTETTAKISTNGERTMEAQASVFTEIQKLSELTEDLTVQPAVESSKLLPAGSVEAPTTLMLKQLPQTFARGALATLLNSLGFEGMYDFIYMPMNLLTKTSFTYAFVNMVSAEVAEQCRQQLDNYSNWPVPNSKACVALWAVQQGLEVNVERYRNSPVMHPSVPGDFKPALYKEGREVPFPPPTRELKAPKARRLRK